MVRRVPVPPSSGADLAVLLATEQRLEVALADARVARIAAIEAEADREVAGWDRLDGAALGPAVIAVLAALQARLVEAP